MRKIIVITSFLSLFLIARLSAQEVITVPAFDKVIISPHIQVNLLHDTEESVLIQDSRVSRDKIKVEVAGGTLRVYLEGAKEITKNKKVEEEDGQTKKKSIYTGTNLTLTIKYKTLNELSVRGEEQIMLKSKIEQDAFRLKLYGETIVTFSGLNLNKLQTTIYGESTVELKSGTINEQRYTLYGESKINAMDVENQITNITSYGEAKLNLKVSKQLKVTAFGETEVNYKGNPVVKKGMTFGQVRLNKISAN